MPRERRVFIPNDGNHDYRPAERFGKLTFVTRGEVNKFNVGELYRKWETALQDSTEDDYIIVSGLPILVALGASIFAHRHGGVRFLLFKYDKEARRGDYAERHVYLGGRGIDE